MCDKDHFAESVAEYEARGLVTRRQFGVLLAAGAVMTLPQLANAQATSERDVEIKTPDGTCDAYFVHPSSGAAAAVLIWPDIFGLRPAMRTMGKRLAGSGYSVLVVNPFYRAGKPTATGATPIKEMMAFRKGMSAADGHDGCEDVRRLARRAAAGEQEPEGRRAGLLHGRPDVVPHGIGDARPHRRRRVVPRRRARQRHGRPEQSASAGGRHEGVVPDCHRRERRQAAAERQDRVEGNVRQGQAGRRRSRSTRPRTAGARRIRRSTTSRRPRRRGAACSRCTGRRWPKQITIASRARRRSAANCVPRSAPCRRSRQTRAA